MNSKRAKKLRNLVEHWQNLEVVDENWLKSETNGKTGCKINDLKCGRSVYQAMKRKRK
jgi:hypothetical protein